MTRMLSTCATQGCSDVQMKKATLLSLKSVLTFVRFVKFLDSLGLGLPRCIASIYRV